MAAGAPHPHTANQSDAITCKPASSANSQSCYRYGAAPRAISLAPRVFPGATDPSERLHVTLPVPNDQTAAPSPAPAGPPTPPEPPAAVKFPLGWLLDHAAPPIQYRALVDVARIEPLTASGSLIPITYRPALLLAVQQSVDGTWNDSMLGIPSSRAEHFEGIGTIPAVRRLLEYGWDRDTPPIHQARRVLFRLLAEDDDPDYLYEFGKHAGDEDLARRSRAILREAAAAALAQAGYEGDPRLRGAARRIIERIASYLRSPLAEKPFVRVGNQHVLPQEAAPPSMHALTMLAFMPLFRTEHHEAIELIYAHLTSPLPRTEAVQLCGKHVVAQPHLVLGDQLPHRNAADDDVASAIAWLELMARLGYLKRNENWLKLFERFLDERDAEGVWHPRKGSAAAKTTNPFVYPLYPLEDSLAGDEKWTDLTFRLGLIARLLGRPIDVV